MQYPFTQTNLLTGPVRILRAPTSVAVPNRLGDIISLVSPYTALTGWLEVGATEGETEYSRDMDSEEIRIEQATGAVLTQVTEVVRTLVIPGVEITPELTQLVEEGPSVTTVAAAAGQSAYKKVSFGSIDSLTRHRIAVVAERDIALGGVVTEPTTGIKRGPLVGLVGYQTALTADDSGMEWERGNLVTREIKLTFFPDSTITDTKAAEGAFLFETVGTFT